MTKKAKLIILRHGQTDYNRQRLMTGQRESTLTELGEAQAQAAGTVIKHIHIDKVYSSPLSRAFNTAAMALKAAGKDLPIEKRAELIEADAGQFAGRNIDTDPEVSTFNRAYGTPMPGGESDKDVVARVQKVFDREILPALKRGETVMVTCHSGVVHAFDVVLGVQKAPPDNEKLHAERVPNAAPIIFEYEDGVMTNHYFIENPATKQAANQNTETPPRPPAANKNSPKI